MPPPSSRSYLVLTPTEERVVTHLTSQKLGASISQISHAIHLARTSIYNALDSLIDKRIVIRKGFDYTLASEQLKPSEAQGADARKQIASLLREMLQLKRGEILYSIESDAEIKELLETEGGLLEWQKTLADKGIVLKGIGSSKALTLFRSSIDKRLQGEIKRRSGSARFTIDAIPGSCMLVSFRDSIVYFSRKHNYFYRIDNADAALFAQSIIESLYLRLHYHKLIVD
ncbi:MAG: hypothetical protein UX49_C0001G0006 [Candidatus Wolfebacteria bacterium GW2011_GWC2_46_275]|uniref:Transcription regulator TrmB N-terminal domain-containing protein n=2 Tax=Candidatus Wolfeibacteriota TaxID=1752735 RepID=A0A0G1U8C1_9BACT|nr:MAG: hypothetical protein UX70_C0001G0504 [Candidatus Wolfebacteria bacterium GW2011_GWB1_47_1]KKU37136.1 MAG: hypothetical protein UX49_C0001G0006 [Candidatus Wolfebacteria bacterium GW2011_GWC2_46_275]KKU42704.1 MAG: hypothetical protein UX58_C0001G0136 [Candidatus Wolfebacteria bacterium GW2011_GWB2_46_69]KKU54561.1 MAG: hypothetical protein UX76_C0001G0020 [Candidatus Wolfebacteria bacterium GW2011_GWC1_47_103]KKU59945.1 MAG: hypothetical protein UX83_C0001G0020 [Candidatus Wolfebacteria